ncbi:endolytic transglycosylase MltG [Luteococcus sediminum]
MSGLFMDNDGNRNWKKIGYHARSAFAVLLSLAVLVGGAWFVYDKANTAYTEYKTADDYPGPGGKAVLVTIPAGASGGDIGDVLVEQDVVKSRKAYLKASRKNEQADKIQAGTYRLQTQIPATQAVEGLLDEKNIVRNQVTIPEGLWMSEQFELLSKRTKIPVKDFEAAAKDPQALGLPEWVGDSAEGYLFPSTYEIGQQPTAKSILTLMAKQFTTVANRNDLEAGAKELDRKPEEIMTVASILEDEAVGKDQAKVAGVIYNRLDRWMPLQLDSTAHYQLQIPMNEPLPKGFKEKGTDNSFNTYANAGLPKHPMNAPGEDAIKAALNPEDSDYLYWLTVNFKTGETKFAETYEEHQKNKAEWEAWCKTAKDKSGCPVG